MLLPGVAGGSLEFGSRGEERMFNNALSMIAVEVVCVFSFCGWFEHLNIYYCTSRDVSLKVHVHIVVNIQLWKTSCPHFHMWNSQKMR